MALIRLQISCKWTKRRATWSIVALLPWQCCLSTCQQVYSRPQAIGPALLMTISSLLGCGLCTGVLSEALRYILPGEGTAPANVSGAETTSQLQKVVLDPISGHDLSRHADPVSAVHCKSDCDVGGNLLKIIEEFLSSPDPPAALWRRLLGHLSSLTLLVKGGMLWIRCSRFASGPGGTSETSSFASLGILCIRRILYGGLGRFNNERA